MRGGIGFIWVLENGECFPHTCHSDTHPRTWLKPLVESAVLTVARFHDWPAPGARILHSIGTWPAVIDDETVVENCITGEELVLLAKIRPAAEARITLQLTDIAGGCRVAMTEVAVSAPLRWVPDSVQLTAVAPRNRECTWRLAMIAENADPDALG